MGASDQYILIICPRSITLVVIGIRTSCVIVTTDHIVAIRLFTAFQRRDHVANPDGEKHALSIRLLDVARDLHSHSTLARFCVCAELLSDPVPCSSDAPVGVCLAGQSVPGPKGHQL